MAKCKVLLDMLNDYGKNYDLENSVNTIGCELEFLPYEKQLEFKKKYIENLFKNKGFDIEVSKIYESPIKKGYRNKMEYSFGDMNRGGELNLGLHVPGRYYDIESTTNLDMVDDDFNNIVKAVQEYCRNKGYSKFHKRAKTGLLRNLNVRKGKFTGEILIGISTTYEEFDEKDFVDFMLSIDLVGEIVGIIHLKNDLPLEVVKSGKDDKIIYGRDYYIEKILGLEFKVSFFSFFQTNSECTEVLYTRVREIVKSLSPKKALDLFCGTGTISQVLSKEVKELVGVEIVEDAVEMAVKNSEKNGITNCKYIAGDVFKVLKDNETYGDMNADLVILDPPRAGVGQKAIQKVAEIKADNILYVSCNPRTLAIDYVEFKELGYEIRSIEAVDMYPSTKHVECIVLIQKKI